MLSLQIPFPEGRYSQSLRGEIEDRYKGGGKEREKKKGKNGVWLNSESTRLYPACAFSVPQNRSSSLGRRASHDRHSALLAGTEQHISDASVNPFCFSHFSF